MKTNREAEIQRQFESWAAAGGDIQFVRDDEPRDDADLVITGPDGREVAIRDGWRMPGRVRQMATCAAVARMGGIEGGLHLLAVCGLADDSGRFSYEPIEMVEFLRSREWVACTRAFVDLCKHLGAEWGNDPLATGLRNLYEGRAA
jgi:hypothetical protein